MNINGVRLFKASELIPSGRTEGRGERLAENRPEKQAEAARAFGLGVAGVHEVCETRYGDRPAAAGFALAAANAAATNASANANTSASAKGANGQADAKVLLWIAQRSIARDQGFLSSVGHQQCFKGAPQILFVHTSREIDALWAAEEALASNAVGLVAVEIETLSFTASRRLRLACERTGVPAIVLASYAYGGATAADARWRVSSAPSSVNRFDPAAPGCLRWRAHLERCRAAPALSGRVFTFEHRDEPTISFDLVAELASDAAAPTGDEPTHKPGAIVDLQVDFRRAG